MTALAHPCPICAAPAGEPCAVPRLPLCAPGVHAERLYPRACPECGAVPGVPCPGGHTHARRDPSPVDWRARHVRMWREQGRLEVVRAYGGQLPRREVSPIDTTTKETY